MVGGGINDERLPIPHPGDNGGWRPSGHTGQSTRLLLVGQRGDGGTHCCRRETESMNSVQMLVTRPTCINQE